LATGFLAAAAFFGAAAFLATGFLAAAAFLGAAAAFLATGFLAAAAFLGAAAAFFATGFFAAATFFAAVFFAAVFLLLLPFVSPSRDGKSSYKTEILLPHRDEPGGLFIGASRLLLALMNSAPAELLHLLVYAALQP
jgi:hypothetical protein